MRVFACAVLRLREIAFTVRNARKHASALGQPVRHQQRRAAFADRVPLLSGPLGFLDLIPVERESQPRLCYAFVTKRVESRIPAPADRAGQGGRGNCRGDRKRDERLLDTHVLNSE